MKIRTKTIQVIKVYRTEEAVKTLVVEIKTKFGTKIKVAVLQVIIIIIILEIVMILGDKTVKIKNLLTSNRRIQNPSKIQAQQPASVNNPIKKYKTSKSIKYYFFILHKSF